MQYCYANYGNKSSFSSDKMFTQTFKFPCCLHFKDPKASQVNPMNSSKIFGHFSQVTTVSVQLFIFNPIALRKAKIANNFGLSECNIGLKR